jgi:molybdopterin synthase sulfur carrier subunit
MTQVWVAGETVRDILDHLEERFPGIKARLLRDGELRPDIAVAVDGEIACDLLEKVPENSEVHFVPPISGGM